MHAAWFVRDGRSMGGRILSSTEEIRSPKRAILEGRSGKASSEIALSVSAGSRVRLVHEEKPLGDSVGGGDTTVLSASPLVNKRSGVNRRVAMGHRIFSHSFQCG